MARAALTPSHPIAQEMARVFGLDDRSCGRRPAAQKALDLLRQYEAGGDNQALKDFAAKASTVVQAHLDKLNGMQP
jgi:hypothetical protein